MLTIRLASETREVITETQIVVLLLTLASMTKKVSPWNMPWPGQLFTGKDMPWNC